MNPTRAQSRRRRWAVKALGPVLVSGFLAGAVPAFGGRTPSGDWPMFGRDPARTSVAPSSGAISAVSVGRLRRQQVELDGTVDSSPIYLGGVRIGGRTRNALLLTTTYGKTLALDAGTGRVLWRFTPPDYESWAGTYRITTATPVSDRAFVYTASPDGRVHKLSLQSGQEAGAPWPVPVTRDPAREKLASALNLVGGRLLVTTGGYIGDTPPYQGHVVALAAATGHILGVFNSLCSDRHEIISPDSCPQTRAAIWGRSGAVADPRTGNLLVATGNGPWDGRTSWGDSVLELSPDASRLVQNWTPANQQQLEQQDADVGSTAPALLGDDLLLQSGKDGALHLLDLRRLNGRGGAGPFTGGELQNLRAPGGASVFTAPAVWRTAAATWIFVANGSGTAAYRLEGRRLRAVWQNRNAGTSPVVAGGLLYVYDPGGGGLRVYRPGSRQPLATLPAGRGHWNSPIVVDGLVALPEGDANDHAQTGVVDLYRLPR